MNKSSSFLSHTHCHLSHVLSPAHCLPSVVLTKEGPLSPKKGFTLMEVMVTIVIIGILSTLGISTFQSTQKKSRDVRRKVDLQSVVKALNAYMNDKGVYPASSDGKILWCGEGLACNWGDPLSTTGTGVDEAGNPTDTVYMASLPKDTLSTQTFFYEGVPIDGKVKGYKLYARLENTKDSDVPKDGDGNPSQYDKPCRPGDTTNSQWCNYVITSDTVAAPTGCGLPKTGCASAGDCCTGSCLSQFYAYTSAGYTDNCALNSFCDEAPGGYTTTPGTSDGESCGTDDDCCSDVCTGYYAHATGLTCTLSHQCGSAPAGSSSTCCVVETGTCDTEDDCCSGLACTGGSCVQPCVADGDPCTEDAQCCTGKKCGTDADNDNYFSIAKGHTGTCQDAHPWTDCKDTGANANLVMFLRSGSTDEDMDTYTDGASSYTCFNKANVALATKASISTGAVDTITAGQVRAAASQNSDCCDTDNRVYPGSQTKLATPTNCGGYDYDCSGIEEKYGTIYYGFSGCMCTNCQGGCNGWTTVTGVGCGTSGSTYVWGNRTGSKYQRDPDRGQGWTCEAYGCEKGYMAVDSGSQICY